MTSDALDPFQFGSIELLDLGSKRRVKRMSLGETDGSGAGPYTESGPSSKGSDPKGKTDFSPTFYLIFRQKMIF